MQCTSQHNVRCDMPQHNSVVCSIKRVQVCSNNITSMWLICKYMMSIYYMHITHCYIYLYAHQFDQYITLWGILYFSKEGTFIELSKNTYYYYVIIKIVNRSYVRGANSIELSSTTKSIVLIRRPLFSAYYFWIS